MVGYKDVTTTNSNPLEHVLQTLILYMLCLNVTDKKGEKTPANCVRCPVKVRHVHSVVTVT